MIQVYVTEIPKEETECPFYGISNKKCRITGNKCSVKENGNCEHLLNMKFDFFEEEDEDNGIQ